MSYADFKRDTPLPEPFDNNFEEAAKAVHYVGCNIGLWSICSWPPTDPNRRNAMFALAEAALGLGDIDSDAPNMAGEG